MTEIKEPLTNKNKYFWLVYLALLLGGGILIAQSIDYAPLIKWTAKLGIALLFSAFALLMGNGRKVGYVATSIIWIVIIISYFL